MSLANIFSKTAYKIIGKVSKYDSYGRCEKLMASQYLPEDNLEEIQWRKLQKLLEHACENVPFYASLWKQAGVAPKDIRTLDDLKKLPAVERHQLQSAPQEVRTANNFNVNYLQRIRTSGSTTGSPFGLFIDEEAYLEKYALYLRAKTPSGWKLADKMISMWHKSYGGYQGEYDGNESAREPYTSVRNLVNLLFERKKILPPFSRLGTGVHLDEILGRVEAIWNYRPRLFESFNFLILIIAHAIEKYSISRLEIPIIYCLGPLAASQMDLVKRTLGGEIYDRYGPHEMEGLGYECEKHTGLHISAESYIVEFLPVEGGDIFELAITDLDNHATPLIRYRIGDLARPVKENCPCGRTLPLMSHILGRSQDIITTEAGNKIAPAECEKIIYSFDSVSFFSLEQKKNSDIILNVVPRKRRRDIDADAITNKLRELLGKGIRIELHKVDEIPSEKNGKFRFVKSTQ